MTARAEYRYRALRRDGAEEIGTLAAVGREAVSQQLLSRRLLPISIEWAESRRAGARPLPWADAALGFRLLAGLLGAGLPLDRALAAFAETAPPRWRNLLPDILDAVKQGRTLGDALGERSLGIPPVLASLVQAGEAGSGAHRAVDRAADLAESIATARAAIRQALTYPAILAISGALSLGFLVTVVLPRFAAILSDMGQALPTSTRLVLAAANGVHAGLVPAIAAVLFLFAGWRAWVARPEGRRRWHELLLRLPILGRARFALATARATGAVGSLLESGVTLSRALEHGAAAASDGAVREAILRARSAIVEGEVPSRALGRHVALTPTALRLVRAGEESGQLGQMLLQASRLEQTAGERLVRGAIQLVEPAFILVFGALVALVAAALLQALYGVRPV